MIPITVPYNAEIIYPLFIKRASLNKRRIAYLSIIRNSGALGYSSIDLDHFLTICLIDLKLALFLQI